jgi:galactose-1-phosphate uridylyltransferase
MAKKSVAKLKDQTRQVQQTKVVVPVKNPKTGAYSFRTEMVSNEKVEEYVQQKQEELKQ